MVKTYYFTECKTLSNLDVERYERTAKKDAEAAENEAKRCRDREQKFHMELNFRLIPQAPDMRKNIRKIRSELKRPNLSKTRRATLERSLIVIGDALDTLLKYGEALRK